MTFPVTQRELLEVRKSAAGAGADPRRVDGQAPPRRRQPSTTRPGRLDFVDVQVNQGTDTVAGARDVPEPERHAGRRPARDGVIVETAQAANSALLIPQQALQIDQAGPYVLIVDDDNKVELRRVKVGDQRDGTDVSSPTGLKRASG